MRVILKGHPSKLPPEAPSRVSPEDPLGNRSKTPLRSVPRVPERPLPPLRSLSKPSRSPAECLLLKLPPKPLPDRPPESATCPGSQPEGRLPESLFRHAFEIDPSIFPSEHATCPEGQAESYPVSPSKPPRETFRIYPRNTPRVSECRAKTLPPEAARTCHLSPSP